MASFSVATFNALNLLHPGVYFAGRPNDRPYSRAIYEEKLAWMSGILKDGDVSLVGLQELFSEVALSELAAKAGFSHRYAPDLEGGRNLAEVGGRLEASGPFLGLLSQYPLSNQRSIVDFPGDTRGILLSEGAEAARVPVTRFQRPVLQADVDFGRGTATVFVAHLKSKRPQFLPSEAGRESEPVVAAMGYTRSLMIRAAESVALRKLIVDTIMGNQQPVILFGDLNDDVRAVSTQIIAGDEPWRFDTTAKKRVLWDRLLYSVHDLEEEASYRDVSYTHIYNGRYELLDHIWVSEELYHRNPERVATVRYTRIFNDHLEDERRIPNPGRGPSPRSDHGVPVTYIEWLDRS